MIQVVFLVFNWKMTMVSSWLPTSKSVPPTVTTMPPDIGPKLGETLVMLGVTAVKGILYIATLESILKMKFLCPGVPKLVVWHVNCSAGMKSSLIGIQGASPSSMFAFSISPKLTPRSVPVTVMAVPPSTGPGSAWTDHHECYNCAKKNCMWMQTTWAKKLELLNKGTLEWNKSIRPIKCWR